MDYVRIKRNSTSDLTLFKHAVPPSSLFVKKQPIIQPNLSVEIYIISVDYFSILMITQKVPACRKKEARRAILQY